MSLDNHISFHAEVAPRLVSALLLLKLRRPPYPWEVRLCEAIVFGELVVKNPPSDIGLRQIHEVAADIETFTVLYGIVEDGSDTSTESAQG